MLNPTSAQLQLEAFDATKAARTQVITLPKIVGVVFPGNNTVYSYHSDIEGLQAGDYAIVAAPRGDFRFGDVKFHSSELQGFPTVVRVVTTEETVKAVSKAAKWIIQKIDIEKYVERLAYEQRIEVLQAKIQKAKKEALERAQLATLRTMSPELDLLITELATLTGVPLEEKPIPVRAHKRKRTVKTAAKKPVSKGPAKSRARKK